MSVDHSHMPEECFYIIPKVVVYKHNIFCKLVVLLRIEIHSGLTGLL